MKVKIPIIKVKDSKLLSLVLIIFICIGLFGSLHMMTEENFIGVIGVIAACVVVWKLLCVIVRRVNFVRLKKEIQKNGLESYIASSVNNALKIYAMAPGKMALTYIKSLNPKAAEIIISIEKQKKISVSSVFLIVGSIIKKGGILFIAGIIILVYNAQCYHDIDVPIEYENYKTNLPVNTYAKMNIMDATPIGTRNSYLSNKNTKIVTSSYAVGVYFYAIDDSGTEGLIYIPLNSHFPVSSSFSFPNINNNYKLSTPLQVYGCIGDTPSFKNSFDVSEMMDYKNDIEGYYKQRSEESTEFNNMISGYALLEVNSLTPKTNSVREGKGLRDEWIFVGIVLLIVSVIFKIRKKAEQKG